jgi:hypothetical protein
MAFYGKLTRDENVQVEACRWYSKAIHLQLNQLAKTASSGRTWKQADSPEGILSPLMLALFESTLCTSAFGWMHHVSAAAEMLESIGPEACQSGIMHELFRSTRINMVRRASCGLRSHLDHT